MTHVRPMRPTAGTALTRAAAALTVDAAFRERAAAHPARIALVQDERRISYAELQDRVDRLCLGLLRLGVQRGDRIAVLSENRFEYVEVLLAAAHIGAIVACQNWRLSAAELEHCLRLVGPRVVIRAGQLRPQNRFRFRWPARDRV